MHVYNGQLLNGPANEVRLTRGAIYHIEGWAERYFGMFDASGKKLAETDGYDVRAYFQRETNSLGVYLGPDADGVEPRFDLESQR